jgi:integrative and conjugative element protein (TIGR02256 family)
VTRGQQRANRELERLQTADPNTFQLVAEPRLIGDLLVVDVSIRLGPIVTAPGGLRLREREQFRVVVPSDFPFESAWVKVEHNRFAGFPHVVWSTDICLYQSKLEWNPSDGIFGLVDRLILWLGKTAANDMDPLEGPLEPPHHHTDFSKDPFLIRANAPVQAGQPWFGLAELRKSEQFVELTGWTDSIETISAEQMVALAVILPKALPMEFPTTGKIFFQELFKQGMDRNRIMENLAIAAHLTANGDPIYLVLGIPMRRAADGSARLHIAVWVTDATMTESLRLTLPRNFDSKDLTEARGAFAEKLYELFEHTTITWCPILEDRPEVVVARDEGTSTAWLRGKKILLLGCGAIGSWSAELVARAGASTLHLVDTSIVKPGLVVRQNYRQSDIGTGKAKALAQRMKEIAANIQAEGFRAEAFKFLQDNMKIIQGYDLVLDCSADRSFQMKLERDWPKFRDVFPRLISLVIDGEARRCLAVYRKATARCGIWDAFVQTKRRLCLSGKHPDFVSAFYSSAATRNLFQPEPGCSDPTFRGSAADVSSIASNALNLILERMTKQKDEFAIAFSSHSGSRRGAYELIDLMDWNEVVAGEYRVGIAPNVLKRARGFVQQNRRQFSGKHETGGLLWGNWDDAIGVASVFDLSGPPPDSIRDPGQFVCGTAGTREEHDRRHSLTSGVCGFVGFWHTHPDMPTQQSGTDVRGMAELVSKIGENQRRAIMMIFGRHHQKPAAALYVYESIALDNAIELLSVGTSEFELPFQVA